MKQIYIPIDDDISGASTRLRIEIERLEVLHKKILCILYPPSLAERLGIAESHGRAQYDGHVARPHPVVPYEIIIQYEE